MNAEDRIRQIHGELQRSIPRGYHHSKTAHVGKYHVGPFLGQNQFMLDLIALLQHAQPSAKSWNASCKNI